MRYKVHKWIAVTVGVVVIIWFISGIVMILPSSLSGLARQRTPASMDFQEITMSPAEAVASLSKDLGAPPQVTSVQLRRIRDAVVYKITVQSGGSHLVDARSGQLFTITPELAKQIARDGVSSQGHILEAASITRHDFTYLWGPLPVYRIVFDDNRATVSHVSLEDGRVVHTDRWGRFRGAIIHLHTFHTFIIDQNRLRKSLLLVGSVVGIGAVATGYYLVLPHRRRSRPAESPDQKAT